MCLGEWNGIGVVWCGVGNGECRLDNKSKWGNAKEKREKESNERKGKNSGMRADKLS